VNELNAANALINAKRRIAELEAARDKLIKLAAGRGAHVAQLKEQLHIAYIDQQATGGLIDGLQARIAELERHNEVTADEHNRLIADLDAELTGMENKWSKAEKVIEAARYVYDNWAVADTTALGDALAEYDEAPDPGAVDGA